MPGSVSPTITIQMAPSTTSLTSSNPNAPFGTEVTFTAQVVSTIAGLLPPTGIVTFYDGDVAIGTGTVNANGIATFTTSSLAPGTHTITAVYSGDTTYTTSTSGPLTQIIVSTADFDIQNQTPPQIIPPGASAGYTILLTSVSAPFTGTVTLSASNLPPGATYTFTPPTVVPGVAGATTTFTVQVPQSNVASRRSNPLWPGALALLLVPLACVRRYRTKPLRLLLWLVIAGTSFSALAGCGTGRYFSQPQQTYVITVTGTSGSLAHSTTVTLTVQ